MLQCHSLGRRSARVAPLSKLHRSCAGLLRTMAIDKPDQVWGADITYIPMRRGFLYLVAIMDWLSRRVLY